jgi:hypothetical protein
MLICVCLRILGSSRILQYDLGRQTPHFWGGSVTTKISNRGASLGRKKRCCRLRACISSFLDCPSWYEFGDSTQWVQKNNAIINLPIIYPLCTLHILGDVDPQSQKEKRHLQLNSILSYLLQYMGLGYIFNNSNKFYFFALQIGFWLDYSHTHIIPNLYATTLNNILLWLDYSHTHIISNFYATTLNNILLSFSFYYHCCRFKLYLIIHLI